MSFRDILAVVTSQAADEHVIAFAEQLARQTQGRVGAAVVKWLPNAVPVETFVASGLYADLVETARKDLTAESEKVRSRLKRDEAPDAVEPYFIEMGAAGASLGLRARHADVTIVSRPTKTDMASGSAILEAVLFDSGRPVILVPPGWKPRDIGRNVVIAWKPTREAARAVGDADAFVLGAQRASLVTVDASASAGYGEQPAADIAAHLAFRGARAEVFNLPSGGRSEADAILDQAAALGADLMIMGGYGHARLREMVFGGVTREIVRRTTIPVLMSH